MVASEDLDAVVAAAQAGDDEAFRRLYRAQQPALVRYLRVLVGDDAEDVASESWLQIARDLRTFSGDWDGFRGWTATIARHRAMDLLRAQRRRPQAGVPVEFLAEMSAGDDTADRALELVTTEDAVALIASLPPEMAEAVMLRVVVGLDATSTGRILGRRAGTVRTAAYRGLRQLAAKLAQRDPRHPPEPPRPPSWKPAVTTSAAAALKEMR
ncbi:RNA polymerase sigma factor [Actinoplanes flavus]|uniref:RNA polymerase sigma factor n=1 Tax=Actinoplanes flavus TaxID=2820290 RepID=A0ABS3UI28_9ACTN|nr:RNA polymerase sigma factor [Actinoplanes flavus]MBO3738433.1 RNA polymerase sigma factor [Actinoplanes flavus]